MPSRTRPSNVKGQRAWGRGYSVSFWEVAVDESIKPLDQAYLLFTLPHWRGGGGGGGAGLAESIKYSVQWYWLRE